MGDQFCLLCHYILAKILPIFSLIRSITCHKLIDDDSHRIEVSLKAMIFSEQNFRCHVARSPTCVLKVIRPFLSRDPKICEVEIAYLNKNIIVISSTFGIKHQILRFDISVYNPKTVDVFQGHK